MLKTAGGLKYEIISGLLGCSDDEEIQEFVTMYLERGSIDIGTDFEGLAEYIEQNREEINKYVELSHSDIVITAKGALNEDEQLYEVAHLYVLKQLLKELGLNA